MSVVALPFPWVQGQLPAGSFEDMAQQNFDALAEAIGTATAYAPPITIGSGGSAPAFQNSWTNVTGYTSGFFKDSAGFVHLFGVVKSGASGTTVFTLPARFRPIAAGERFGVSGMNGATASAATVIVAGSGDVTAYYSTANEIGLSGVSFRAAQ